PAAGRCWEGDALDDCLALRARMHRTVVDPPAQLPGATSAGAEAGLYRVDRQCREIAHGLEPEPLQPPQHLEWQREELGGEWGEEVADRVGLDDPAAARRGLSGGDLGGELTGRDPDPWPED